MYFLQRMGREGGEGGGAVFPKCEKDKAQEFQTRQKKGGGRRQKELSY